MKVVFYTVLCGRYDGLPKPPPDAGLECHLFNDGDVSQADAPGFTLRPLHGEGPSRRLSRAPKLRPHAYLPAHDVSVYADANVRWNGPMVAHALEALGDADMAAYRHPNPTTKVVQQEARKVVRMGLDYAQVVEAQMSRYWREGFQDVRPVTENCFLVRRDTPAVRALHELWWQEYCRGSQRDQISLQYCCWKLGFNIRLVGGPGNARDNHMYKIVEHLKPRRVVP